MAEIFNTKPIRILYVQAGRGVGGAKISLLHIIKSHLPSVIPSLIVSPPLDNIFAKLSGNEIQSIHSMPLPIWYKNPTLGFLNKLIIFLSRVKRGGYFLSTLKIALLILQNQIDLVHSNSSATPVGALAAKLTGRPHIWHIREPLGAETDFPLIFDDYLATTVIKALSVRIICISDYVANFFKKHGIHPVIVLNGIDTELFKYPFAQNELRAQYGLGTSIVIGMVGSLAAVWKEHLSFLQAASLIKEKIPDARFIVYGGSSNLEATPYTQLLKQKTIELGLSNKIIWADHVENIPLMMDSIDIFIHPVSREGSGRVVMEAMASGISVITVKSGGVQELIQDGVNGYLVAPKSPELLAEKAVSLCDSPQLRQTIGKRAQEYAEKNFSHERTACQIFEIYRSVLMPK